MKKILKKYLKIVQKVVSVHSEDEEILNMNKKLIKDGDVHTHPIWRSEESAISSTRRIVRIAERYKKKHTFCMLQQNKRLIFYRNIKEILRLK